MSAMCSGNTCSVGLHLYDDADVYGRIFFIGVARILSGGALFFPKKLTTFFLVVALKTH